MIKSYCDFETTVLGIMVRHLLTGGKVYIEGAVSQQMLQQIYYDFNYNKYLDDLQLDHTLYYELNADEWMQKEIQP